MAGMDMPGMDMGTRTGMPMRALGHGVTLMAMAQAFPILTLPDLGRQTPAWRGVEARVTQPALMLNLSSRGEGLVLRTTLNAEALTQPTGEATPGGWGEGYLDRRHPHTVLHELMLSAPRWQAPGASLSVSAGKGFVAYGTDDPMGRAGVKFPTNHHLSQLPERWLLAGQLLTPGGLSAEATVFGGAEPEGPWDLSNVQSFGDSWAARLTQRFGGGAGPGARVELGASYAVVRGHEASGSSPDHTAPTRLVNLSARHAGTTPLGSLSALVEGSRSHTAGAPALAALVAEASLGLGASGRHVPYARLEVAGRPEYARMDVIGTPGFFRYAHDGPVSGTTHWTTLVMGYGVALGDPSARLSVRPFAEVQASRVRAGQGGIQPARLFGASRVTSLTLGARLFFGGGPMRMGSYGLLDPMSAAMRPAPSSSGAPGTGRHAHPSLTAAP